MIVEVWTDGSGTTCGPWGYAAILRAVDKNGEVHEREVVGWGDEGTNNVAELTAAIEGLRVLTRPCKVEVITDSKYVMNGFVPCDDQPTGRVERWQKRGWVTSMDREPIKNRELWEELDREVRRHRSVNWRHVKGHAKIDPNERCDKLAGQARRFAAGELPLADLFPEEVVEHLEALEREAGTAA